MSANELVRWALNNQRLEEQGLPNLEKPRQPSCMDGVKSVWPVVWGAGAKTSRLPD